MKTLYLDCGMGAAGDMLTGALVELLPDPEKFIERLNTLGIPGVRIKREAAVKCGVRGTHISVSVNGEEESEGACGYSHEAHAGEADRNSHEAHAGEADRSGHGTHTDKIFHEHQHAHPHRDMHAIRHIIENLSVPEKVKADILAVYGLIAEAESSVHGVPVSEIHFHEVGTMDAIADITAVCMLMNELAPDRVVVSPVHVGCGQVRCAHGILPVPAPATALLLKDMPIYGGEIKGELCTPTGAALLRHFADGFGAMPVMKVRAIGYGMGKKDFAAANCVRAMLGETEERKALGGAEGTELLGETEERKALGGTEESTDEMLELSCNVDDMTAEEIAYAVERLFEGGAAEVYTVPIGMKKSRPGTLLRVICARPKKEKLLALIFRHTTTIGVRETVTHRYILDRRIETLNTDYGEVRRKVSSGYGVTRSKYEYDDLARIAKERQLSIGEVRKLLP